MISSVATTAPTQFLDIGGTRFAYRRFGTPVGIPLVFTQHFMGNLDNFDPAIIDALAPQREIILARQSGGPSQVFRLAFRAAAVSALRRKREGFQCGAVPAFEEDGAGAAVGRGGRLIDGTAHGGL